MLGRARNDVTFVIIFTLSMYVCVEDVIAFWKVRLEDSHLHLT